MRKIGSCERFYGFTTKVNQVEKRHIVKNNWVDIEYHYIIGRKEQGKINIYEAHPRIKVEIQSVQ